LLRRHLRQTIDHVAASRNPTLEHAGEALVAEAGYFAVERNHIIANFDHVGADGLRNTVAMLLPRLISSLPDCTAG
jgi:hypothetical protein